MIAALQIASAIVAAGVVITSFLAWHNSRESVVLARQAKQEVAAAKIELAREVEAAKMLALRAAAQVDVVLPVVLAVVRQHKPESH